MFVYRPDSSLESSQMNPQHNTETKRNGLQHEALTRQFLNFLMNSVSVVKETGEVNSAVRDVHPITRN